LDRGDGIGIGRAVASANAALRPMRRKGSVARVSTAFDIDTVIIGAGVVGLSIARELVKAGRAVWVLEQAERAGEGVSSRNSGVIHAGLYYPPGSHKARFCVRGRDLMYEFCARRGVPHARCGKLVVATTADEIPALRALEQRSRENGVRVTWRDSAEASALEPALRCAAALESPDSGIIDVPDFVMALIGEVEQGDSRVLTETEVTGVARESDGFRITTARSGDVRCRQLVNAAGLEATDVAALIVDATHIPKIHYAAGHYYALRGKAPFTRLIYPLPNESGLGVHLGFDSAGRSRFGPDVRWQETPDYDFDDSLREGFLAGVQSWFPALDPSHISPDFVGVRPKLSGAGEHAADFCIHDEAAHGVHGLVNLFGIDSPGLTSAMAIGEYIAGRLR
jgi:L-2-hydroxyglutarate oxidase LhgO